MVVKIGTRGSQLALWQAYYVENLLQKAGLQTQIVTFETKGDKILEVTLAKIGSKGVFTEELETALLNGEIHIAVHSAKDLPSTLPQNLEIIAFTEREKVNDVLVSYNKNISLSTENIVVGTSSTRRNAILHHYYPAVKTVDMRGNLQTRMRKLQEGACDAILLAFAGVHRMNLDEYIAEELSIEQFTPPVGQGSVAIEASTNLDEETRNTIKNALNHQETEYALLTERAFLKELEGGCSIPSFAYAKVNGENIELNAGLISLDGQQIIRKSGIRHLAEATILGKNIAVEILENGGKEILEKIRKGY